MSRQEEAEYQRIRAALIEEERQAELLGRTGKVRVLSEKEREVLARMRTEQTEQAGLEQDERMRQCSARYISGQIVQADQQQLHRPLQGRDLEAARELPPAETAAVVSQVIKGRLFLAGILAAAHWPGGFTHVLIASNQASTPFRASEQYLPVNVEDVEHAQISQFFDSAADWVDQALQQPGSTVLVHCRRGMSRSASLVLAFLVRLRWRMASWRSADEA